MTPYIEDVNTTSIMIAYLPIVDMSGGTLDRPQKCVRYGAQLNTLSLRK